MKNIRLVLAMLIVALAFAACKKDIVDNPNDAEYTTDLQQFEAVWNGINTCYVLWPIDTTDWDAVYRKYYPIFADMDDKPWLEWYEAWEGVASTLIDHHMSISLRRTPKEGMSDLDLFIFDPGFNEVKSREYYHESKTYFDYQRMLKRYVNDGRLTDSYNVYYDFNYENCYAGVLDGCIAYIHITSFQSNLDSIASFQHFRELVVREDVKAAIIDVRDNRGGKTANLERELACFTSEPTLVGYQQNKIGLGRYELSPTVPVYAYPNTASHCQNKDIPVVVLVDVNSASMSESTAIAFKSLPQSFVVGERTFGAFCTLNNNFDYLYSGTFGAAGQSHYVKMAKFLCTGPDSVCYEGIGVIPDKECFFDSSEWANGVDNQLECAISFAKDKIAENRNR